MLKTSVAAILCFLVFGIVQAQQPQSQQFNGRIDNTVESQHYDVTFTAGDPVVITANAAPGASLDTVLTLYDPNNQEVAQNDDANDNTTDSQIDFIAHTSGDYRIVISRYDSSSSGSYRINVVTGDTSLMTYTVRLTGAELTQDTQHFRFHYTRSGADAVTPAFLGSIEQAFEDAWHIEIDTLGWPAPPSDGTMGGNSLFDVFITDLIGSGDGSELGFTEPVLYVVDNPNTPTLEKSAAAAFIDIDNDFSGLTLDTGQTPTSVMRSTAMHEFNHGIQFGFDALEPQTWLLEATATWMETVAAGKDQDATDYVSTAYEYPELCLGTTSEQGEMYGEWPFMQFLTDEFGKDAVLNLWQQIAQYDGFDALQHYLDTVGSTVPREVARYRINNLARHYKLAPLFKATVWLENTITGIGQWTHGKDVSGVQELGANYFAFTAAPGVYDLELRNDAQKLDLWAIGVTKDNLQAIDLGRGGGIDTSNYQQTYLMVFNPTYDNDVNNCSFTDYRILVMKGKGTTNPVDSVWDRTYFEPLKASTN